MLSSSHKFCIKQKEVIMSLFKTNHLFLFDTYFIWHFKLNQFVVVEPNGVEPLTSCVQGRRSTN